MAILVNSETRLMCQGITGSAGSFHCQQMLEYGTQLVAGVTPGKGGQTHLDRPVYNSVKETVDELKADTSIIFVPPAFAAKAIIEAAEAGIKVIIPKKIIKKITLDCAYTIYLNNFILFSFKFVVLNKIITKK